MRLSSALPLIARGLVLAVVVAGAALASPRPAQAATNAEVERFLATLAPGAKDSWYRFGVPASVTLAQAALESGWGESSLSKTPNNNYFGIKCNDNGIRSPYQNGCVTKLTTEYRSDGSSYQIYDEFRTYASPAMSMMDHGYYLTTRGLYDKAFLYNEDPKRFATEVRAGGYATDPGYATLLHTLIDQRKLTRFDWRSAVGGPPSPGAAGAGNPPLGGPVTADPQLQQKSVTDLAKQANVEAPPVATSAPAQSPSPTDTTSSATTTPATTTPAATTPASSPNPSTSAGPTTVAATATPRVTRAAQTTSPTQTATAATTTTPSRPVEPARDAVAPRVRPRALPATGS